MTLPGPSRTMTCLYSQYLYSCYVPDEIYRSAASVLLLRKSDVCSPDGCGAVYQILLLHKPRKRDAWQLPQGGVEGKETMEQAALRELKEETGLSGVNVFGPSAHVYQYDFPGSYRRFRPDNVKGQRIEFILALLTGSAVLKLEPKEVDDSAWVLPEQLHLYIKRQQYLNLVKKMYEEAIAKAGHKAMSS